MCSIWYQSSTSTESDISAISNKSEIVSIIGLRTYMYTISNCINVLPSTANTGIDGNK